MIEWILQTNSTVTTTILQQASSQSDQWQFIGLVVGIVLGGSGVAGWILTFVQLREQKRVEARDIFREQVMNKGMLDLWACGFSIADLYDAFAKLAKGEKPLVTYLGVKGRKTVQLRNWSQWNTAYGEVFSRMDKLTNEVSDNGTTFLLPKRLKKKYGDFSRACMELSAMVKSSRKISHGRLAIPKDALEKSAESVRRAFSEFGDELKRVLGIDLLD